MSSRIRYFTPGPVQMSPEICAIGGKQVRYFRNAAFSELVLECERMMLTLAKAPEGSRAVLLTSSGTGGLEAALSGFALRDRPTLIVNTMGFGQRLVDICDALDRPVEQFKVPMGVALKADDRPDIGSCGAIACNAHDTISGVRNHLTYLGEVAREAGAFFIVDAISSFLCDPIDMAELGIDVLVTGAQKALAVAPGIAVLVLSPKAVAYVMAPGYRQGSYYFDLAAHLREGARGQTPYTPAVSVIYQLHARLKELVAIGIDEQVRRTEELAQHFRKRIAESSLPFRVFPDVASSGVTALEVTEDGLNADEIVHEIGEQYGIFLTPNGGSLRDRVFRVSHMGVQTIEALDQLVDLFREYFGRFRGEK